MKKNKKTNHNKEIYRLSNANPAKKGGEFGRMHISAPFA